jgi:hypothetical protein
MGGLEHRERSETGSQKVDTSRGLETLPVPRCRPYPVTGVHSAYLETQKGCTIRGNVLIIGSPCWGVLPVQRRQEMVSELQKTVNSIEQSGESI